MDHCKFCTEPRRPRIDRPGKFFTMCTTHYNEYMAQKNREHYARNQELMQERKRRYRLEHPEEYKASCGGTLTCII